jgi:hypothetical protein
MLNYPPLVVAILHSNDEDVRYQLYLQAYGLEMQIDDAWNAELVLLAPCNHLTTVTEETDVTGEDTVIVSAGVTDVPLGPDGVPVVDAITTERNNWLLLGDPRNGDTAAVVNRKLRAALDAMCRVILLLTEKRMDRLPLWLGGMAAIDGTRIVFALACDDTTNSEDITATARQVRERLAALGAAGVPRFIVAGCVTGQIAAEALALDGVDGVMLMDHQYGEFDTILEVLAAVG